MMQLGTTLLTLILRGAALISITEFTYFDSKITGTPGLGC